MPEPPETVLDVSVHEKFVELVLTLRLTVAENPSRGDTVVVELPVTPCETEILVGLAVTV